ncbi:transglycosylase domain-containing protein [Nocardioides sp. DS6]|uniref:Transglycosylase domain-containing protein n=1 Tax=Nocardioides eburneus TaxID=3231482 RepID=A0ABV3T005_9ACTN
MSDQPSNGKRRATNSSGNSARTSRTTGTTRAGSKSGAKSGPRRSSGSGGARRGSGTKAPAGKPLSKKQRAWRIGRWFLSAFLAFVLILVVAAVVLYKTTDIPSPNEAFKKETTFVYYADGKHQVGRLVADNQNRNSLSYDAMPDNVKAAVVAAEDRTFWTNNGIDPKGIIRAAFSNARGNATQGASTITQQYVKILYLNQERSYKRKIKEAILSLKIKRQYSKEQILEGYLNTIYFGRGAYGIQAASQAYFGIDAKDLNLRQAAVLASVLNNPYGLDPANGADAKAALKERYDYVLSGMAKAGDVTAQKADWAEKHLPAFPKPKATNTYGGQMGHALTMVKSELLKLGFTPDQIEGGGLRVKTTLTRQAMNAAEQGVKEAEPDGFSDKKLHVGVASVQPGTGELKGFYGGQDFLRSQLNWAATDGGMVGSTMKPFTLAAGLTAGYSLKDTFDGNSPKEFSGVTVHNEGEAAGDYDGHDYGRVSALTALEQSINTAYVDMSASLPHGAKDVYDMARAAGIPPAKADKAYPGMPATSSADFRPDNFLLTLGNSKISPINLANAYATIDNGGVRANVHIVQKVTDRNGTVLYKYKPSDNSERVMSEDVADDVSYALQQTVQHGTGQAALALGRPAAGKTGTATKENAQGGSYVSSSWFVGYTPQLVTAVMYVRGDGDDQLDGWLPSYFGADYPARTWTAVMERALDGADSETFPPPAWVDGEAPSTGHAPMPTYTPPPPKKTQKPKPHKTHQPPKTPPTPHTSSAPPAPPTTEPSQPQPSKSSSEPAPKCSPWPVCNEDGGGTSGGGGTGTNPNADQPKARLTTTGD